MAINTTFKSVSADYERNLDVKQIVMQCNFDTTSKGGVSKVCALSGDVRITKTQTMSKQIKTSGRVCIKLVYLDAEGKLNNFDYISDFSEDVNNDNVIADMPCLVRASVIDMQSSISGSEIKVQTVVELAPTIVEINTVDVLEDAVCALSGDVRITKTQTMSKQIKTSGRVCIKLVYLDAEGKLNNFDYISDFSEDVNNDNVIADMPCLVRASVIDMQSSISGSEIKVQTVVELAPTIVEINTVDVLEDAEGALALKQDQQYQKYICAVDESVEIGMSLKHI
ncbi:MAG: DUF3794 domain-containing protein [Clostridia bacterium]|nr:DUF3794 domain-containing protein [Clostridia bacterium]